MTAKFEAQKITTNKKKHSVRSVGDISCEDISLPSSYITAIEILFQPLQLPRQAINYAFIGTSFIANNNNCSLFITALHNKRLMLHTEKLGSFKSDDMIEEFRYDICAKTIDCSENLPNIPASKTIPKNESKVLFCGYPGNSDSTTLKCIWGIIRDYDETSKCFFVEGKNATGMSGGPVLFQDDHGEWKAFAVISARLNSNVAKQDIVSNSENLKNRFDCIKSRFDDPDNCMIAVSLTALEI